MEQGTGATRSSAEIPVGAETAPSCRGAGVPHGPLEME